MSIENYMDEYLRKKKYKRINQRWTGWLFKSVEDKKIKQVSRKS